jgi:glutamine synthetase
MQGRLVGKRIEVGCFLDEVADHGVEGCNSLLAPDIEMDPVPGYEVANSEKGYGDFTIAPDLATRGIPWLDRTALVVAMSQTTTLRSSPRARQVLIAQSTT